MPFHFCADELLAIMALIPIVGALFKRAHVWYHAKVKHKTPHFLK